MYPYLRKNLRIVVMCNLEAVSVIRRKCGARLGTYGLHDGTSALGGISGLEGSARLIKSWLQVKAPENALRRCPNPRRLKNGWKSNYVDITGMELYG